MVYQGPSRGCGTCKQRRKKCDETRPSCLRCIKANRICAGYEKSISSSFQSYEVQGAKHTLPPASIARKCTLPVRVPIPGTEILPDDIGPQEIQLLKKHAYSVRAFIYEFCVVSPNINLSRGFLPGVETMYYRLGSESNLAKACYAVAAGTQGKVLRRPNLTYMAKAMYHDTLGCLARAIDNPSPAHTDESKIVAMLLGLYQMTMANETEYGSHEPHAKGLAALLDIGHSPLDLFGAVRLGCLLAPDKIPPVTGIFSIRALDGRRETLNDLLLDLNLLWKEHESCCASKDLERLRKKAFDLYSRFAEWQDSRVAEFTPTKIGNIHGNRGEPNIAVGHWPGKVDTYFDLYVSGVWNVFRGARLLVIALIIALFDVAGDTDRCIDIIQQANQTAEDMIASVPYHLTENLHDFLDQVETSSDIKDAGRFLGGFLLIHPLYLASRMGFLPTPMRDYLRKCLAWIGSRMGIGEAAVFAKKPDIDTESLASGCMIIWSGFIL